MTEREYAELLRRNPELRIEDDGTRNRWLPIQDDGTRTTVTIAAQPKFSEHDLQVAVIAACDERAILRPEYGLIFAIPNGGARHPAVAAKLKAEGVKPGVLDLLLPVARHGYHGLFIELKVADNKPSEAQLEWIRRLRAEGYRCDVLWDSVDEVIDRIEWYLEA